MVRLMPSLRRSSAENCDGMRGANLKISEAQERLWRRAASGSPPASGVTTLDDRAGDANNAMRRADDAMYAMKSAAGDRPRRGVGGRNELWGCRSAAVGKGFLPSITKGLHMILLGLLLLIVGIIVKIGILYTIGLILLVVGVVLFILGSMGRAVGGRRHYY